MLLFRICFGAWAALVCGGARTGPARQSPTAGVRVRSSRAIASPVTVAAGIVLPADYAGWDTEKLRIVLAHESSHVRQRDFFLQLAASLYIALFWFNPLGWWLKRKLTDLSETISDGAAVNQAASHASYAQVLLEFAALPRPITIGVAMAHRGHLRSRIEHLLNENNFRQAFSGGRMRLAAAVLLVPVALFAATAMVRVHAAAQQTPLRPRLRFRRPRRPRPRLRRRRARSHASLPPPVPPLCRMARRPCPLRRCHLPAMTISVGPGSSFGPGVICRDRRAMAPGSPRALESSDAQGLGRNMAGARAAASAYGEKHGLNSKNFLRDSMASLTTATPTPT